MGQVNRPKRSRRALVLLLVAGILFVVIDVVLISWIVLQGKGVNPIRGWFASKPTSIPDPVIQLSPSRGRPGSAVAVSGQGWEAGDPVAVYLEDTLNARCPAEIVATPNAGQDGSFAVSFDLPADGCWAGLPWIVVTARSLDTEKKASVAFQVQVSAQTPTPTATWTPAKEPTATSTQVVEPTPTPTATPTAEPTATATTEPTPTSTPTPTHTPTPTLTHTLTPTPTVVGWRGEYFDNIGLTGTARLVRNDPAVNFDWQQGSPGGAIPNDNFSVRWTRQVDLDAGIYRFHALVDDGVRLWVSDARIRDDRLIVDAWSDHDAEELITDCALVKGTYTLKVEYYERIGNARIQVWWEKVPSAVYLDWKGEYWSNRNLSGDPVLVRNDRGPDRTPGIEFKWGAGSPSPNLPTDNFAARWTRALQFQAGTYRFHVLVDDGVRLWVDGQLLIDAWYDSEAHELTADHALVAGTHTVRVEYYERGGGAQIRVWWKKESSLTYPDWKGEYWSNRDLSGSPALVRNDRAPDGKLGIDFDWKLNAPAVGLPADNFAVRWSRQVAFDPGSYRFYVWADDGVRVYVDDTLVLDEWHGFEDRVYSFDLSLSGAHRLKVEYVEQVRNAGIRFWWEAR